MSKTLSAPGSRRTSSDSTPDLQINDTRETGFVISTPRSNFQSSRLSSEQSPFLPSGGSEDAENLLHNEVPRGSQDWQEEGEVESKSVLYLFVLTLSIGGLQIAWGAEMSNGSPFLLSLGLSKSMLAFVWIAGPLSGVLVQPYIGIRSDNSRISWGKRKPFMVAGAAATTLSFLALAWTKEIVHGFLGLFGADSHSQGVKVTSIVFAVALVYILDIAINAVQAAIRAFIVDNAPTHQQEDANAWAGRITGVGNIVGYLAGYLDLPKRTGGIFGNTQFKVLCVIASFALCSTVAISTAVIPERNPRLEERPSAERIGILSFFRQVFNSMKRLQPQIRKVCEVQIFNWVGWFPFLYYMTTYIGQLHLNAYFAANPSLTPEEVDQAWEGATRVGTFALLIFALVSFASSMLLPFIIVPTYEPPPPLKPSSSFHSSPSHLQSHAQQSSSDVRRSASLGAAPLSHGSNAHSRLTRLLSAFQIRWLTLRRAWLLSHLLFFLCMLSTFFITTPAAATVLAGIVGLPWALSLWAPFALISAEISKRDAEARRPDGVPSKDQAGVILGLHNVAISAPQVFATLVSSAIFKATQKSRGSAGDDSVGWVLRFGGVAALIAAYMTYRVGEEGDRKRGEEEGEEGAE